MTAPKTKSILITGGTGLIGRNIIQESASQSFSFSILSRAGKSIPGIKSYFWNPDSDFIDVDAIKNAEAIIHLAGAGIADKRWTDKRKKEILNSRVKSSELLYNTLASTSNNVNVVVSSSATGIYGDTFGSIVSEDNLAEHDFLGMVCQEWESAISKIESLGIRVVILRTGFVLSTEHGGLPVLTKLVKNFLGAALGNGKQYIPWIHIEDLCEMYVRAVQDENMQGVYNAVAPRPETNNDFMKTLAHILCRPVWPLHVPAAIVRLLAGEKSSLILRGQRVSPKKILDAGFEFRFPDLTSALENLYPAR